MANTPSQQDLEYLQANPQAADKFKAQFGYVPASTQDEDYLKQHPELSDKFAANFGYLPQGFKPSGQGDDDSFTGLGKQALSHPISSAIGLPSDITTAALKGAGQMALQIPAGLYGIAKGEIAGLQGKDPFAAGSQAIEDVNNGAIGRALQPTGPVQQGVTKALGLPTELANRAGEAVSQATGSPLAGTATNVAGNIAAALLPIHKLAQGMRGGIESGDRAIANQASSDLQDQQPAPPEKSIEEQHIDARNNNIANLQQTLSQLTPKDPAHEAVSQVIKEEEFLRDAPTSIKELQASIDSLKNTDGTTDAIARLIQQRDEMLSKVSKIHDKRDQAHVAAIGETIDQSPLGEQTGDDIANAIPPTETPDTSEGQAALQQPNTIDTAPNTGVPFDPKAAQAALDALDRARQPQTPDRNMEQVPQAPGQPKSLKLPKMSDAEKESVLNQQKPPHTQLNPIPRDNIGDELTTNADYEAQGKVNDAVLQNKIPQEIVTDPAKALTQMESDIGKNEILPNVDATKDVPYLAGSSVDGKTLYIQRGSPRTLPAKTLGGHPINVPVDKYLRIHEAAERWLEANGVPYDKNNLGSHPMAEAMENETLRRDGIDPQSYQDAYRPYIAEAQLKAHHGEAPNIPDDLVTTPYQDAEGKRLLETNGKNPEAMDAKFKAYETAQKNTTAIDTPELYSKNPISAEKIAEERAEQARAKEEANRPLTGGVSLNDLGETPRAAQAEGSRFPIRDRSSEEVQSMVDKLSPKFEAIKDKVKVVSGPEAFSDRAKAHFGEGSKGIMAYYDRGEIHINAEAIKSPAQLAKVLLHESYHYGIRRFGGDYASILKQIELYRRDWIDEHMSHPNVSKYLDINNPEHRFIASEEYLAEMAEKDPKNTFVQGAIAAIRQFLRKIGFDKVLGDLSDAEIIHMAIDPVRKYLTQQRPSVVNSEGVPKAMNLRVNPESPLERAVSKTANLKTNTGVSVLDHDVIEHINDASKGLLETMKRGQATFNPQSLSEAAGYAARSIRENFTGYVSHDLALARKALSEADQIKATGIMADFRNRLKLTGTQMGKLTHDAKLDFIDRMERGKEQPSPELENLSKIMKGLMDSKWKEFSKLEPEAQNMFLENYFPHIWKDASMAQTVFSRLAKAKGLEGGKAFMKERIFNTIKLGIEATKDSEHPLELATDNPVDLVMMKIHEMDKFIAASKTLNDLWSKGIPKEFPKGDVAEGYTLLDSAIARLRLPDRLTMGNSMTPKTVGKSGVYLPNEVAQVFHNYLSPGLRQYAAFRGYLGVANTLNMAQLGLSFYHLGFTSMDAVVSKNALGLELLAEGKPLQGVRAIVSSPLELVGNFMRGNKLLEAYYDGSAGGEMGQMVQAIMKAGGRLELDHIYKTGMYDAMKRAIEEGNYTSALFKGIAKGGLLEGFSKIISDYVVPRQKLGVFFDLAKKEMERLGTEASPDTVREALGKAWDSVDNRMGQMVYDNLFWNNAVKDAAFGSIRSLGWNIGTVRELGGGIVDLGKSGRDLAQGKGFTMTHRMAYTAALPLTVGILGTIIGALMGNPPDFSKDKTQGLYDLYFPRTGNKDLSGRDQRLSMPTYMKDVFQYLHNPGQTITDKLNPLPSALYDMFNNKDFYGTQIHNPDASWPKQRLQDMEFMAKNLIPFGIRNAQQEQKTGTSPSLQLAGFFGLTKAPYWLEQTEAEQLAGKLVQEKMKGSTRTPEQYDKSQLKNEITSGLQNGDKTIHDHAVSQMTDAIRNKQLSVLDAKQMVAKSHTDPLVWSSKHLDAEEIMRVWNIASDEEKDKIRIEVIGKVMRSETISPEQKTQYMQEILRRGK